MASEPKQHADNKSLRNLVSDLASWARSGKASDDQKPSLDDVLNELGANKSENSEFYSSGGLNLDELAFAEQHAPSTSAVPAAKEPPAAPPPTNGATMSTNGSTASTTLPDETVRRADGHRQRLEKLLDDARNIEEMLAKEAAEAAALAKSVNVDQARTLLAAATQSEREAAARANELTKRSEGAAAQLTQTTGELDTAREVLDAANDAVAECQARLVEAQKVVIQAKFKLRESQVRAQEASTVADAAKAEAREAERRASKLREAREAAQAEVQRAEEIAGSIAVTSAALERIRALGAQRPK